MNVRKFVAENSRVAMRQVRHELGDDAVILSTRQVADGVEIMAVSLPEMVKLQSAQAATATAAAPAPASPQPAARPAGAAQSFVDFARRWTTDSRGGDKTADGGDGERAAAQHETRVSISRAAGGTAPSRSAAGTASSRSTPGAAPIRSTPGAASNHATAGAASASMAMDMAAGLTAGMAAMAGGLPPADDLMAEIKSMRSVLEAQLASLAWSDSARRSPLKTKLATQMLAAGFSAGLARAVAARLPDDYTNAQAESWLASIVEANVRKAAPDELITKGGVYALVGPTGVGKTTTTAKLAARYVMKYGAQKLGLISADSYRIGAQDQLRIYGRILGVPVHAVQDAGELHATLAAMRDKHLVLIDTIGVGQRDERVAEQVALLGAPGIKRLLLLNAACAGETLDDVVRAYAGAGATALAGCCISKLDEAVKPGTVLDAAIRHKLPLHFVSTGQRVPEDLHLPNVSYLVHRALKYAVAETFRLTQDEAGLLLAPPMGAARAEHAEQR